MTELEAYLVIYYSVWVLPGVKKDIGDVLRDKHAEQELEKRRNLRAGAGSDTRAHLCGFHTDLDVQPWR